MAAAISSIDMIRRLIGFDTTSRESNLALIDFVRDYLDGFGIASELVFDATRRKANLYATIGRPDRGGVMLSGHSDVVPVDGQAWDGDPFTLAPRDELLYGRGTSDMKSFIAVMLALVPEFIAAKAATPVHLAMTYDEEVGCIGVRGLIRQLADRPAKPRLCIIGEPTSMQPVVAHKGKRSLRCHVRGHESHSALAHAGVNAVEYAADIVAQIRRIARRKRDEGPFDPGFSPPYTTIQTGTIAGGTALNIVPRDCRFDFEIRFLPGDDPAALLADLRRHAATIEPDMHRVSANTGIDFEEFNAIPALSAPPDSEVVRLAQSLTGANSVGKVSFGTEGGLYQQAGIPTVICGPGSIEQAHRPDEWIALDQVRLCEAFFRRLIERIAPGRRVMAGARVEVDPPDITPYRAGNTGIDYVTTYTAAQPGPHVVLNALTHGNEICGAIALDRLLRAGLRPARGRLTFAFANFAAYRSFDRASPNASRYVDEDFNRLWDAATLDGPRRSAELARARALRPLYESADLLLDIHSMQHATAPLMLIGLAPKTETLARRVGVPALMVRDKGHDAGPRLRDFGAFADPAAAAVALLAECGQHWEKGTVEVALETSWRFLAASGVLANDEATRILAQPVAPQRLITVTDTVTVVSDDFQFVEDYRGLEVIAKAGTIIGRDGGRDVRTPYDDCVLIMPSRRLGSGQTAVRLGRYGD